MVNITNYANEEVIPDDILGSIFEHQKELMVKYKDIEQLTLKDDCSLLSIQTKSNQKILKDFAWRTTEELCEMQEAKDLGHIDDHVREELSDALHFLVELCILSGMKRDDITINYDDERINPSYRINSYYFIMKLGMAMNLLKNKPWKVSEVLLDEAMYKQRMIKAVQSFFVITKSLGLSMTDIYNLYSRKNKVNNFRVDTKY